MRITDIKIANQVIPFMLSQASGGNDLVGKVMEVGAGACEFSASLLKVDPNTTVTVVDDYKCVNLGSDAAAIMQQNHRLAQAVIAKHEGGGRLIVVSEPVYDAVFKMKQCDYDTIYLKSSPGFGTFYQNLKNYTMKLREGGLIFGPGYQNSEDKYDHGIKEVIDDYYRSAVHSAFDGFWFAIKGEGQGYYKELVDPFAPKVDPAAFVEPTTPMEISEGFDFSEPAPGGHPDVVTSVPATNESPPPVPISLVPPAPASPPIPPPPAITAPKMPYISRNVIQVTDIDLGDRFTDEISGAVVTFKVETFEGSSTAMCRNVDKPEIPLRAYPVDGILLSKIRNYNMKMASA